MNPQFLVGDSNLERSPNDFYETPEHATRALLDREEFHGAVWEPACGRGAISKVLMADSRIRSVHSTDLNDYGFGYAGYDFLSSVVRFDHVITNPPYSLAEKFVRHALKCARSKVALLLKLNFLEGQKRFKLFQETRLAKVYIFSKRLSFDRKDAEPSKGGLLAYAWFVWDHNVHRQGPMIDWIEPCSSSSSKSA